MAGKKKCKRCGREVELSEFSRGGLSSAKLWDNCKSCRDELRELRRRGELPSDAPIKRYIDMTGEQYGRLTVVKFVGTLKHTTGTFWECRCDCGNTRVVRRDMLISGEAQSCGEHRKQNPKWSRELLENEFVRDGKSITAVANEHGVKRYVVSYQLVKHGFIEYKPKTDTICKHCGKYIKKSNKPGPTRLYCGKKCKAEWERTNKKRYVKTCPFCGKIFSTTSSKSVYCAGCRSTPTKQAKAVDDAVVVLTRGSKACTQCGVEKPLSEFSKTSAKYDGHASSCKKCNSIEWAKRKAAGKIKRSPDSVRRHRERERIRRRSDPVYKAKRRGYEFMRRHTDPAFRLKYLMKYAIWKSLRKGGGKAGLHWEPLVGFTLDELRTHLESKFEPGMSWGNAGKWHIDHAVPISFFNFTSSDDPEFKMCWELENLQPMWGYENMSKGSSIR